VAVTYTAVVTFNLQVSRTEVETIWIFCKNSETSGLSDKDIFLDVCSVFGAYPFSSIGDTEDTTFVFGPAEAWDMFSGNVFNGRQMRYPSMTAANWGLDNTTNSNYGTEQPGYTKYNALDSYGIPSSDFRMVQVNVPGVEITKFPLTDSGTPYVGNLYFPSDTSAKMVNIFNFTTQEPFFKDIISGASEVGRFGTSMIHMKPVPTVTNIYTDQVPNADFPPTSVPYPGAAAQMQAASGCPPSDHPPASSIIGTPDSYGRADNAGGEIDYPGWSLVETYSFEVECLEISPVFDPSHPMHINSDHRFKVTKGTSDFDTVLTLMGASTTLSSTIGLLSLGPAGNFYPHAAYFNTLRAGLMATGSKFRVVHSPLIAGGSAQMHTGPDIFTTKEFIFGWGGTAEKYQACYWATMPTAGTKYPVMIKVIQYDECGGASGGAPAAAKFAAAPAVPAAAAASAPTSTSVPAISVPATPSFSLSGGSILLLHSNSNPPTKPANPVPEDFFTKGRPASGASTLNHAYVMDSLTDVTLTNNSINTIFYYLMDAAQNINYLGEVSFYVDENKPVGFITAPSGASWDTPYTAEWLGKNKMAPFDGRIEMSDLPETNPIKTWPYTI
jgi:hypothetical protein